VYWGQTPGGKEKINRRPKMAKIDPNAAAFPSERGNVPESRGHGHVVGLTMRAHLASMAMQGLLASPTEVLKDEGRLAQRACRVADAMTDLTHSPLTDC
jgi:hypothetical protein